MNCSQLFLNSAQIHPKKVAFCIPSQELTSFEALKEIAQRAQSTFKSSGIRAGMSVLIFDSIGVRLYGAVIALMAMGVTVVLIEPWMSLRKIQESIQIARPSAFISNSLGFVWGIRVTAIRKIRHWISISSIRSGSISRPLEIESVDGNFPGMISFTSGTSGVPKGVVRSHEYLIRQHSILDRYLHSDPISGPDLCIFANFVLANLASGRGSIVIPPQWNPRILKNLDSLPNSIQPESLTAGPAFLFQLMKHAQVPRLKSIHIGGASTDCWIFEKGFKQWPNALWRQIYGGSEVEPVALADAKIAVQESQKQGFYQTLYLGHCVKEIQTQIDEQGIWVSGPHVCPEYLGNSTEHSVHKKRGPDGVLWHFMGDRISLQPQGWWYRGRSNQLESHFILEQNIYQNLQSSHCFVHSNKTGQKWLIGEGLAKNRRKILNEFPELQGVVETPIYRDRRHRARLDRTRTLLKGPPWLIG